MRNLNQKLVNNLTINSNARVYLVHLGDNIKLATAPYTLGSNQYLCNIKTLQSPGYVWSILQENRVTISSPQLIITNHIFPDGSSLLDTLISDTVIGKRCTIYLSYIGLTLEESLLIGNYYVDYISVTGDEITVNLLSNVSKDVEINGRKISIPKKDEYKLGQDTLAGSYVIPEEANGKYLPISFGQQWCAPVVLYAQQVAAEPEYGNDIFGDLLYATFDSAYWAELNTVAPSIRSFYQYNIDRVETSLLLPDNDWLVPLSVVDWYDTTKSTYSLIEDDDNAIYNIRIRSDLNGSYSYGKDKSMFTPCPIRMKYAGINNESYGTASSDLTTEDDVNNLFSGYRNAANYFTIATGTTNHSWAKCYINADVLIDLNVRNAETGIIYSERIVTATEMSEGTAIAGFSDSISPGITPVFTNDDPETYAGTGVTFVNFAYKQYPAYNSFYSAYKAGSVISKGQYGATHFPVDYLAYNIPMFGDATLAFGTAIDFGSDTFDIANSGDKVESYADTNAAYLNRDTLNNNFSVRMTITAGNPTFSANVRVEIANVHYLYYNSIKLEPVLGLNVEGQCKITTADTLLTVDGHSTNYIPRRPQEYAEVVLRAKLGATPTTLSTNWVNFYDNIYTPLYVKSSLDLREGSGLSIIDKTTFSAFQSEFANGVPYSIYESSDGIFDIIGVKPQYEDTDIVYNVSYNDMYDVTSAFVDVPIVSESDVFTDYVPQLDKYSFKRRWKIAEAEAYDYAYWKSDNSYEDNIHVKEEGLKYKYTTYSKAPQRVEHNGKYYGCIRTHFSGVEPGLNSSSDRYWKELVPTREGSSTTYASLSAWASGAYWGTDAENYMLAKHYINAHCNKRRTIQFTSDAVEVMKLQLGDVIGFSDVPYKFLGLNIAGFNDSTTFTVAENGQDTYAAFVIIEIKQTLTDITIKALQLVDLEAFDLSEISSDFTEN